MWILIVIQLTAASTTARSAVPALYSGVAFQEFTSQESCEKARSLIEKAAVSAGTAAGFSNVRSGVLTASCQPK